MTITTLAMLRQLRRNAQGIAISVIGMTALALLGTATLGLVRSRNPASEKASQSERIGTRMEAVGGVSYGNADRTVLIFARQTCPACEASWPFHRRLITEASFAGAAAVLVSTDHDAADSYAADLGLSPGAMIVVADGKRLPVQVVPTVVIVDRSGRVVGYWEGTLSTEDERVLMRSLGARLRRSADPQ